jgi:DNA-binding CsgD family transcriptional regulator
MVHGGTTTMGLAPRGELDALRLAASVTGHGASDVARVVEGDPLLRLHAEQAATGLGFVVTDPVENVAAPTEVWFVGLDNLEHCARCGSTTGALARGHDGRPGGRIAGDGPTGSHRADSLVVGYVAGPAVLAAAHAAHACADVVLLLRAAGGRASFHYPVAPSALRRAGEQAPDALAAGLTVRAADVLLLILAGRTTNEIADRLWLSPSTVRSHCRSLLVKSGAANRRALRALLLGATWMNPAS